MYAWFDLEDGNPLYGMKSGRYRVQGWCAGYVLDQVRNVGANLGIEGHVTERITQIHEVRPCRKCTGSGLVKRLDTNVNF